MTVDPIEYTSGKTTLLAWVQADGTVVVGVKAEGDYGDGAPLRAKVSSEVLRQLADTVDAARTRDLESQLAAGAETLGHERALWIETCAKAQVVVDAACSFVDGDPLTGSPQSDDTRRAIDEVVGAYQDEKGQG